MKTIIILPYLLLISALTVGQNNSMSSWDSFFIEKNYTWFRANKFKKGKVTDINVDTISGHMDSTILWTITFDSVKNSLTKIYYFNARKNKPSPKKFNAYFLFDSLGYTYQCDKKLRPFQKNEYRFNSNGLLIKENQWLYTYNSNNMVVLAETDSTPCCLTSSKIEYFYRFDTLFKEIRTNYTMHKRPYSKEVKIYDYELKEIIVEITDLDSKKTVREKSTIENRDFNTYFYTSTGKLYRILNKNYAQHGI